MHSGAQSSGVKTAGNSSSNRTNIQTSSSAAQQLKLRQTLTSHLGKTQTKLMVPKTSEKKVKSRAPSNSKNIYPSFNATSSMGSSKPVSKILEQQSNAARAHMMQSKNMAMKKNSIRSSGVPHLQLNKMSAVKKEPSQQQINTVRPNTNRQTLGAVIATQSENKFKTGPNTPMMSLHNTLAAKKSKRGQIDIRRTSKHGAASTVSAASSDQRLMSYEARDQRVKSPSGYTNSIDQDSN